MILIYFLFSLVGISTSCSPEINSTEINKMDKSQNETDTTWSKIFITKEQCRTFGIPEIEFSILVPKDYKIQYNPKPGSALRIYKMKDDKIETEIAIGTSAFKEKFTLEQEKVWLEEFKNYPQIKNNPDFSIEVITGFRILNTEHNYYVMKLNNDSKKYPTDTPLNSVGITHPTANGMSGLAIVVSKYIVNTESPLTEIETEIINTIKFE